VCCFALLLFPSAAVLQVDQWVETSSQLVSGQQFEALCGRLSDYLSLRSFFVGYGVTAADVAIWGQLQGEQLGIIGCGYWYGRVMARKHWYGVLITAADVAIWGQLQGKRRVVIS
jgi:hypothetical protein